MSLAQVAWLCGPDPALIQSLSELDVKGGLSKRLKPIESSEDSQSTHGESQCSRDEGAVKTTATHLESIAPTVAEAVLVGEKPKTAHILERNVHTICAEDLAKVPNDGAVMVVSSGDMEVKMAPGPTNDPGSYRDGKWWVGLHFRSPQIHIPMFWKAYAEYVKQLLLIDFDWTRPKRGRKKYSWKKMMATYEAHQIIQGHAVKLMSTPQGFHVALGYFEEYVAEVITDTFREYIAELDSTHSN